MQSTPTADTESSFPTVREIWRHPMPHEESPISRSIFRAAMAILGRRWVVSIRGTEHISPDLDPFILVGNHNQRPEAALIVALSFYYRAGKPIHYLADWPNMLIPILGFCYKRAKVIVVGGKSARIPFFNRFRDRLVKPGSVVEQAEEKIRAGASVGIFPESTMNRDPKRLLRGRTGAALLALKTGVPIVPVGIRFPHKDTESPIRDADVMSIEIHPPFELNSGPFENPDDDQIAAAHRQIMEEIARVSGKTWSPDAPLRRF